MPIYDILNRQLVTIFEQGFTLKKRKRKNCLVQFGCTVLCLACSWNNSVFTRRTCFRVLWSQKRRHSTCVQLNCTLNCCSFLLLCWKYEAQKPNQIPITGPHQDFNIRSPLSKGSGMSVFLFFYLFLFLYLFLFPFVPSLSDSIFKI